MLLYSFKPDQRLVIQGLVRAALVDCLYVKYWREVVVRKFSYSVYEMTGLIFSIFGRSEKMICSSSDPAFPRILPVSFKILVFE